MSATASDGFRFPGNVNPFEESPGYAPGNSLVLGYHGVQRLGDLRVKLFITNIIPGRSHT